MYPVYGVTNLSGSDRALPDLPVLPDLPGRQRQNLTPNDTRKA